MEIIRVVLGFVAKYPIFLGGILVLLSNAVNAWPWSDSSKYRNECYQACVEDSFSKAKALEIRMRCENKCNSLPYSPRDQWGRYDECSLRLQEYRDEMKKEEIKIAAAREGCERQLQKGLSECAKEPWYTREYCRETVTKESQSGQCYQGSSSKFMYDILSQNCSKPSVARPK